MEKNLSKLDKQMIDAVDTFKTFCTNNVCENDCAFWFADKKRCIIPYLAEKFFSSAPGEININGLEDTISAFNDYQDQADMNKKVYENYFEEHLMRSLLQWRKEEII